MFVTFEGPEGAGKSTAIRLVAAELERSGHRVLTTREPGAGDVGQSIRDILLHGEDLEPNAELFLFLADRSQHIAQIVKPAIAEGKVVLCDRHADSTVVYQGYGRGLNLNQLRAWNLYATQGLVPDLTLLLDIAAEKGLERVTDRNRLDGQPLAFHLRIRDGFLKEAQLEPNRWQIVNADASADSVAAECLAAIRARF